MANEEQQQEEWAGFNMDPSGWNDAIPDERGFGIIRDYVIRDGNPGDRFPRPIRQLNIRVERLDTLGVLEDGEEIPLSFYSGGNMERQVKDQNAPGGRKLVPAAKGKNKVAHMLANHIKAGLPLKDFQFPVPVDEGGDFVPLPTEEWVSPKDGETKTENRVHIESAEDVKIEYLLRRRLPFGGGMEAFDVLEIVKILPPDFEVPEDEVERRTIKREAEGGEAPPGAAAFEGAQSAPVDTDKTDKLVALALDGKKRGEALQALLALDPGDQVEPYVSGLSGDAAYVDTLIEKGLLKEGPKKVLKATV